MAASRPTGQATLNASHALAGRLVHGYVFSEGTGGTPDLKNPGTLTTLDTPTAWATNTVGAVVRVPFTNGDIWAYNGRINTNRTLVFPQPPFHVVVGIRNATGGDGEFRSLVRCVTGDLWGVNDFSFALTYDVGSAGWNAAAENTSGSTWISWADASANVFDSASAHHIHLACTTTNTTLYRNGVNLGTQASVVTPNSVAKPLYIGSSGGTSYSFSADYEYVYIFSGTLTTQEIDDLRLDPYALVGSSVPPTRFYLPSTGTAAINPSFDAAWNDTSQVASRPANTTKGTSSFVEVADTEASSSNLWDVCLGRFISEPLAAQTIAGAVKGYIRARESAAGANARSQMVIRVVSGDGSVVRGTLHEQDNRTINESEWVATTTLTAARNARFPTTQASAAVPSMTSVTAQDGDRIVIEVGGRAVNTVTTTFTLAMRFGENAADLAENETGTTEGAPWIEFDSSIQFLSAATPHSASGGMVSPKPRVSGVLTQTFPARSFSGALVSSKPRASGTLTQTFPARSVSGALVSPKPSSSGTLTQTFPARSFSGGMISPKPGTSGTLTQTFPARSISGGMVSKKPIVVGTLTQSGIAPHSISGGMVSKKPILFGALTQTLGAFTYEFTDEFDKTPLSSSRSFSGALVSPKPQISGILSQGGISPHALFGGAISPKPVAVGTLTQTFPARSISGALVSKKPIAVGTLTQSAISPHAASGGMVSPKPLVGGTLTQTFPARSFSGLLVSPKPTIAGQLFQGALFGYEFSGGLISPKPQIGGSLTQTLFPSNITGSLISIKPRISGTLTQTLLPNSFAGALVSSKPKIIGLIAQGQIGASSFSAVLASPKPNIAGTLTQSAIAAQAFSGGLISPKPGISGTLIQQALGGFGLSGGLVSPKPRVLGTLTQTFPARFISGGMLSKKPTITASLTQTILPHTIGGGMVSPRPRLSASFIQNLLTPHVISGGMVSPKPTMKAVRMAEEYVLKVGIEYATKGQLALASGHILLLATDPEGELPVAHPIAIAQRTVEAGYGASPLTFEGPLDPAELKYFTVTWDTELQAAVDSIVPDNGTPEGQTVFLTLSGSAVAAGIQVHAFSQDERSVTFWLKVEPSQQSRTQWSGAGELHVITIRIITVRGQVFERDISFRVKQL